MSTTIKSTKGDGGPVSAGIGSLAGSSGAIAAVTVSGPVFGLGAAGITSGLAAIGSIVGGGMATGLFIVASAPIAGAAAAYGAYKLYSRLSAQ